MLRATPAPQNPRFPTFNLKNFCVGLLSSHLRTFVALPYLYKKKTRFYEKKLKVQSTYPMNKKETCPRAYIIHNIRIQNKIGANCKKRRNSGDADSGQDI